MRKVGLGNVLAATARVFFWGALRHAPALVSLINRINHINGNAKSDVDKAYFTAVDEGVATATRYLDQKGLTLLGPIKIITAAAAGVATKEEEVPVAVENLLKLLLPESAHDYFLNTESAKNLKNYLSKVLLSTQSTLETTIVDDIKNPKDYLRRIVATYHQKYPNGLHELEKNVLTYSSWSFVERQLLKVLFNELRAGAERDWLAGLHSETYELELLNTGLMGGSIRSVAWQAGKLAAATAAVECTVFAGDTMIQAMNVSKQISADLMPDVNQVVDTVIACGLSAADAVDQLAMNVSPSKAQIVPEEAVFAAEETEAHENNRLAPNPEHYFPLGSRRDVAVTATPILGTVREVSVQSHVHLRDAERSTTLDEACDFALANVVQRSAEVQEINGYTLSAAFVAQREKLLINAPALTGSEKMLTNGYAAAHYAFGLLGYENNSSNAQAQQLKSIWKAAGWDLQMMQEASHFLTAEFAKDSLERSLRSFQDEESSDPTLLKLDTQPAATWVRVDEQEPQYSFNVEKMGEGKMAVVVEASWAIQHYGHDQRTAFSPHGDSKSALRSCVQVVLTRKNGASTVDVALYPLATTATIHNVLDKMALAKL